MGIVYQCPLISNLYYLLATIVLLELKGISMSKKYETISYLIDVYGNLVGKVKKYTLEKDDTRTKILNKVDTFPSTIVGDKVVGNVNLKKRKIVLIDKLKEKDIDCFNRIEELECVKEITFPSITLKTLKKVA